MCHFSAKSLYPTLISFFSQKNEYKAFVIVLLALVFPLFLPHCFFLLVHHSFSFSTSFFHVYFTYISSRFSLSLTLPASLSFSLCCLSLSSLIHIHIPFGLLERFKQQALYGKYYFTSS